MKLIKASFLIKEQEENLEGVYKQIEWAGRHCYKSEGKITPDSAKEFVERMIKSGHGAMLEHGTVYLTHPIENSGSPSYLGIGTKYRENKYSKVNYSNWGTRYITTNYRVLVENNWLDDLQYLCEPTEYHEKRTTVKFIMDRIGSQSFCRHRVFSFAQESTRYCNYSKDKFNNELTFIAPLWLNYKQLGELNSSTILDQINSLPKDMEFGPDEQQEISYLHALSQSEFTYLHLLSKGWTPQQARAVLPNSLKTELVMTGFDSDWEHFFKLRCDASAHPQARELSIPLYEEFIKLNKIKRII
jgi:thymidylate synthase (FAD)